MKNLMINRLRESFTELEQAIATARITLEQQASAPPELLERINTYSEMLTKQRNLANEMAQFADVGNWGEVSRHIRLINGLSEMIRDDAREIVTLLQHVPTVEQREAFLT